MLENRLTANPNRSECLIKNAQNAMKQQPAERKLTPFVAFPALPSKLQLIPYEARLDRDASWAMSEGSQFFEGKSQVQATLNKIANKLGELGVPYVVVGGMALFRHGYRRFTEDVEILVTREGLKEIHRKLDGLGYRAPFEGSKNLRDTDNGVKIEFLVSGDYPGDGKPKPVAFPPPEAVSDEFDGIRYIRLPNLIELKLASGMTNPDRIKDIGDVMELIKILDLPSSLADALNPFVRDKYKQLWQDAQPSAKRYVLLWRNKGLTSEAHSLDEMIDGLQTAADKLRAMLADGVTLDPTGGTSDDYAPLVTTDPIIAKKYDMHDEREFMDNDKEEPFDTSKPL